MPLGFKNFASGATLLESDLDGLMAQTVMQFASAAARDAAVTAPASGMHCIIDASIRLWQVYDGSAWRTFQARGADSPEGVVTADIGAVYERTNGGAGTALYVKESGSSNTGWRAIGSQVVFLTCHTWALSEPTSSMNVARHKVEKASGQTVELISITDVVTGGTSVTYDLKVNGSTISGGSGLSATTTDNETDFADLAIADADRITIDPTTVTGAVDLWEVTATLKHTVAIS
jgi:hypothetical protein